MNENINLCRILQNCPKGTKLYSPVIGEVIFEGVDYNLDYPIKVSNSFDDLVLTKDGKYVNEPDAECILFPSKTQRNWSKWKCSKPKFDPKTLQAFDKVLVRDSNNRNWKCSLFSYYYDSIESCYKFECCCVDYRFCIPYNEETKHLVGTKDEAPEYYRYWED